MSQYRARQAAAMGVLPWPCLDAWSLTLAVSRASSRSEARAEAVGVGSTALLGAARVSRAALPPDPMAPSTWHAGKIYFGPLRGASRHVRCLQSSNILSNVRVSEQPTTLATA